VALEYLTTVKNDLFLLGCQFGANENFYKKCHKMPFQHRNDTNSQSWSLQSTRTSRNIIILFLLYLWSLLLVEKSPRCPLLVIDRAYGGSSLWWFGTLYTRGKLLCLWLHNFIIFVILACLAPLYLAWWVESKSTEQKMFAWIGLSIMSCMFCHTLYIDYCSSICSFWNLIVYTTP
jgi:hypothetical protein